MQAQTWCNTRTEKGQLKIKWWMRRALSKCSNIPMCLTVCSIFFHQNVSNIFSVIFRFWQDKRDCFCWPITTYLLFDSCLVRCRYFWLKKKILEDWEKGCLVIHSTMTAKGCDWNIYGDGVECVYVSDWERQKGFDRERERGWAVDCFSWRLTRALTSDRASVNTTEADTSMMKRLD